MYLRSLLESVYLEYREGDGTKTLTWIIIKQAYTLRMEPVLLQ